MMGTFVYSKARAAVLLAVSLLAASAFSQEVPAQVPVTVNVNAHVRISPPASGGGTGAEGNVTANAQTVLTIGIPGTASIAHRPQRQTNAGSVGVSHSRGNVTLNLQPQAYQNAVISLHSVNGKRILNSRVAASRETASVSSANLPPGVYLLSVRGTNGNSFTTRLTHSGGGLNINAVFGAENHSLMRNAEMALSLVEWTITVTATGHTTQTRTFLPVAGQNPPQTFTLAALPGTSNFTQTVGGTSFEMIYVPGGTFTLGCDRPSGCPDDTAPVTGVTVSPYFIARTTVTRGLYNAVMGTTGGSATSVYTGMTWYDAMAFACRLSELTGRNYRMATEAEWEYAAKNHVSSLSGITSGATEEWSYNTFQTTHTGGTDPVGPSSGAHTQKTRRNAQGSGDNITGRFIRSIDGPGPALRLVLSATTDFPPNYVPPCNLKPPVLGAEPENSYRDPRWITGSNSRWTTGSIAIGQFDLRAWDDGTARLGTTNGQWFTSNNIVFVFVPATGAIRTFPYIFLDSTQGSLISGLSFMNGGYIGRIRKDTLASNVSKPTVAGLRSGAALADSLSNLPGNNFRMVDMVNIPASARQQDSRLLDGTTRGWFQDNRTAGGIHHYRKDIDADEFRFTVNQAPSQRTMLANGSWFTVNNVFLRVTHPGTSTRPAYVVDYLYAITPQGTLYHNSFMAYERGDFRMFELTDNNSAVFNQTCGASCSGEIPRGEGPSMYGPGGFMASNGHSTFTPAPCPAGGCR